MKRLQSLLDKIPNIAWMASSTGSITFLNRRWLEVTGLSSDKGLGFAFLEAIHPEDRDRIQAAWQQAIETQCPYETEFRLRQADQTYHRVLAQAKLELDKTKNLAQEIEWVGTFTDIEAVVHARQDLIDDNPRKPDEAEIYPLNALLEQCLAQQTAELKTKNYQNTLLEHEQKVKAKAEAVNQKLTTIWESMTDAYVTLDCNWQITYANPVATAMSHRLVSLAPQKFLGKTHWDVFLWAIGNIVEQEYRRAITDQVAVHFEVLYEQTETWFEIHAYPSAEGLGIYFQDISERKRIEPGRILAEQERDQFFNLSLDMLAITNFEGYFLSVNPSWEKTLGFTAAELMAQPYLDLVHLDDRAETLAAAQQLSEGQAVIRFENRYRCKDGSYRWLLWSSKPYAEQNLIYAVAHDITERKQAEESLRQSEAHFRQMADTAPVLIWISGTDKLRNYFNQPWLDFTGRTMEQEIGNGWAEGIHPDDFQRYLDIYFTAFDAQKTFKMKYRLRRFDGEYRWFADAGVPRFTSESEFLGYIGSCVDITELKEAQDVLEARTHELSNLNNLLAQATPLLNERNQELDSVVHIVSHELKAPLRAVSNLSEWIEEDLEGTISADTQHQVTLLRDRVNHMQTMISRLLDYARIERTQVVTEHVLVEELLYEVINSVAPEPTFQIIIAPEMPMFQTKRLLLYQVFVNLISNSIKHHERPNGSVHVSSQDKGAFYEFMVADDGPGIAPEYHDKIFMIFQIVNHQSCSESFGLGLSIVKKIVEKEGGNIRLESALGKGATFYFTWPK
jgi:PAS domain S-box-containing protein